MNWVTTPAFVLVPGSMVEKVFLLFFMKVIYISTQIF
jgi:hypothetical protein